MRCSVTGLRARRAGGPAGAPPAAVAPTSRSKADVVGVRSSSPPAGASSRARTPRPPDVGPRRSDPGPGGRGWRGPETHRSHGPVGAGRKGPREARDSRKLAWGLQVITGREGPGRASVRRHPWNRPEVGTKDHPSSSKTTPRGRAVGTKWARAGPATAWPRRLWRESVPGPDPSTQKGWLQRPHGGAHGGSSEPDASSTTARAGFSNAPAVGAFSPLLRGASRYPDICRRLSGSGEPQRRRQGTKAGKSPNFSSTPQAATATHRLPKGTNNETTRDCPVSRQILPGGPGPRADSSRRAASMSGRRRCDRPPRDRPYRRPHRSPGQVWRGRAASLPRASERRLSSMDASHAPPSSGELLARLEPATSPAASPGVYPRSGISFNSACRSFRLTRPPARGRRRGTRTGGGPSPLEGGIEVAPV